MAFFLINFKIKLNKGRNKGGAFGSGGTCVCDKCGEKIAHKKGVKYTTIKCLNAGKQ